MIFHSLSNRPYDNRQTFRTNPENAKKCEWKIKGDNEEEKQRPKYFHSIFEGVKRKMF